MASKWAGISDRIRMDFVPKYRDPNHGPYRPVGANSGRWIGLYPLPVWVRLGSRSSWADEDMDDQMIKPVEP